MTILPTVFNAASNVAGGVRAFVVASNGMLFCASCLGSILRDLPLKPEFHSLSVFTGVPVALSYLAETTAEKVGVIAPSIFGASGLASMLFLNRRISASYRSSSCVIGVAAGVVATAALMWYEAAPLWHWVPASLSYQVIADRLRHAPVLQ